jgi:hypothetical protein
VVVAFVGAAGTKGVDSGTLSTTSLAVALGSTANGDFNLVWINHANGTATAATITPPAGETWALIGSGTDGASPTLGFSLYGRVRQSGDSATPIFTFSTTVGVAAASVGYSGCDPTTPYTNATVAAYTGTGGTHVSSAATTTSAGWLVSGYGDRSGGVYTAATGTTLRELIRNAASSPNNAISMVQDTNGDQPAGTYSYSVTSPAGTSVGSDFILRLNPSAGTTTSADVATATGTAYDAATTFATVANAEVASGTVNAWNGWTFQGQLANWALNKGTLYVAHRGGSVDYVEMTAAAYAACDVRHIEAIELSVWRTSDGVWVGSHDQTTARMFGTSVDIPSNTYAAISGLLTTVGGYPIAKMTDLLDLYSQTHVIFLDNKQGTNSAEFMSIVGSYANSRAHFVIKGYYSGSVTFNAALAAGYATWAYYYEADLPNLDATESRGTFLGLDYGASSGAWAQIKAKGKPVLGHVILTDANAASALANNPAGIVTGKVSGTIPNALDISQPSSTFAGNDATTTSSGTASAEAATGTGTAYDATTSATALTNAAAGVAAGTGTANDAAVYTLANAETTALAGTAPAPVAAVSVSAGLAAGSGASYDVSVPSALNAPAEAASGTFAGSDASVTTSTGVNAETASGVFSAGDLTVISSGAVGAVTATAVGSAYDVTASTTLTALAGAALGSLSAIDALTTAVGGPVLALAEPALALLSAPGAAASLPPIPHQSDTGWATSANADESEWAGPGYVDSSAPVASAGNFVPESIPFIGDTLVIPFTIGGE